MKYYNDELQELQQQITRKGHCRAMLDNLYIQREELKEKVQELEYRKQEEQKDVDRLESKSLAAFFYEVIGKKEEKLDKEREEAYAAAVKYDTAHLELTAVENDIRRLETELGGLQDAEEQYQKILSEKAESIKNLNLPEAPEVLRLEEKLTYIKNQEKEIGEAIHAGKLALESSDDIISDLNSAENWGYFDLLGGDMISDMVKHSHLDHAQKKVEKLQLRLRRFKTELADVTLHTEIQQVNIEGFLRFADYFFDGIFADWAVYNRIKDSKSQAVKTRDQIKDVLRRLDNMLEAANEEYDRKKDQMDNLILQTTVE